jgi:transposase
VLATLDPVGMPLATEVLSGECADDPVYEPIIARVREGLGKTGLRYIGDCKIAALLTRASVHYYGDFYLCPLSAVQMPPDQLRKEMDEQKKQGAKPIKVERVNDKGECICIAQGYETKVPLTAEVNGQVQTWTELRFLIQSTSWAEAAKQSLLERLEKAEKAIQNILVRKQGKSRLKKRIEIEEAIKKVLEKFRVEGLLINTIHEETREKRIWSYNGKPEETVREIDYIINSERDDKAISYAIEHLSWRVYGEPP